MARGAWLSVAALLAALTGCSLLVDTDVGVRDARDGGPADAGTGPAECGTISRLEDDFDDSQLATVWLTGQEGSHVDPPVETGGRLEMAFHAGALAGDADYSVAYSHFAYDLRSDAVSVRVDGVDSIWRSSLAVSEPRPTDPRQVGIGSRGSALTAWTMDPPRGPEVFETRPYDPATDRYWRIREAGGALEFETAGESREFLPFAHLAGPQFPLDSVQVVLSVVAGGASDQEGVVEYDDFNQGATATPACPISDLTDPFEPPVPGRLWVDRSANCTIDAGEGSLVANAPAGMYCDLASAKAYSIEEGGSLAVDVLGFPTAAGGSFELHLVDADGDRVWIRRRDGVLRAELDVDDSTLDDFEAASAVPSQWWRIREEGGDLVVETAPDGIAWDPRTTFHPSGAIDLAETRAIIVVSAVADPASAEIGGVNQKP